MSEETEPTLRRTVGGGATIGTVAALGTAAAGGLLGIVVARSLGPTGMGAYNVVTTAFLLAQTLSTLGLTVGLTYYVGSGRWQPGDALRQGQLGALVLGVLGAAVGVAVALVGRDTIFEGVPLAALLIVFGALPLAQSWTVSAALALALDRYEMYALAPLAQNCAALALTLFLTPAFGIEGAVSALAAAHVLSAAWLLGRLRRTVPHARGHWLGRTQGEIGRAIRFGFKSYVPQALQLVSYRADLFVLNAYAAGAKVGQYGVALLVTEVGLLLPRSLGAVVMPRVAALDATREDDHQRMVIAKSLRHTLLLAPPAALILAIGVLTIPFVFGADFDGSVPLGLILIPGVIAIGIGGVLNSTTVGKGRPDYALYSALIVTPPTLALYLWLIPRFEATGAAIASTISYALMAVVALVFFQRTVRLESLRMLLPRREELDDYRELYARGRAYLRERRQR